MKKLSLILIVLLSFVYANAQNPFAEYGYTPKIATLSQGQYNEFFDNDTLVQIGSVLFNTKSKQIVAFVETNSLYSEATLEPDIVSRWISTDPLSEERSWISPYNYCQNNPILRIDPDGALDDEWDLLINPNGTNNLTKVSDKGGDKTQYVNVKWETKSGDIWNLGTKTYNNWPNSSLAMADIKSNGQAALGPWNPKWNDNASGRIDLSPVDPIVLLTGVAAAKWAMAGAKIAAEGGSHLVYEGLDAAGKVRYVGLTGRDATVRFGEHLNSISTGKELLRYRVIDGATGLTKTQARIWEQSLINQYGLGKSGGQLLNKINSIAPKN